MKKKNKIEYKDENFKHILNGLKEARDVIGSTMGFLGENVLVLDSEGRGNTFNDGIGLISKINLNNKYKQYGVNIAKEAAGKTEYYAGDGTSTTTVLTYEITKRLYELMEEENISFLEHQEDVREIVSEIIENIESFKIDVNMGDKKLINMIETVSGGEKLIKDALTEVYSKKENEGAYITGKVSPGQYGYTIKYEPKFNIHCNIPNEISGIMHKTSATYQGDKTAVICFEKGLKSPEHISQTLITLAENKKIDKVLVISTEIPDEVLKFLYSMHTRSKKIIPIVTNLDAVNDIAAFSGTIAMSDSSLMLNKTGDYGMLKNMETTMLQEMNTGQTSFKLEVVGGYADQEQIGAYVKKLERHITTEDTMTESTTKVRISLFKKGIITIALTVPNESKVFELRERLRDTLNSTRNALESGILPGGGFIYRYIHANTTNNETKGHIYNEINKCITDSLGQIHRILIKNATSKQIEFKANEQTLYNAKTKEKELVSKTTVYDTVKTQTFAITNAIEASLITLTIGMGIVDEDN